MSMIPMYMNTNIIVDTAESSEVTISGNGVTNVSLTAPSITGYTPILGIYKGFYVSAQSYATVISYVISEKVTNNNLTLRLYNFTSVTRTGKVVAHIIYTKN